jgi:hypothetical protein
MEVEYMLSVVAPTGSKYQLTEIADSYLQSQKQN